MQKGARAFLAKWNLKRSF